MRMAGISSFEPATHSKPKPPTSFLRTSAPTRRFADGPGLATNADSSQRNDRRPTRWLAFGSLRRPATICASIWDQNRRLGHALSSDSYPEMGGVCLAARLRRMYSRM
jgi:hypothetical protein